MFEPVTMIRSVVAVDEVPAAEDAAGAVAAAGAGAAGAEPVEVELVEGLVAGAVAATAELDGRRVTASCANRGETNTTAIARLTANAARQSPVLGRLR